jgi:hypothetical protein
MATTTNYGWTTPDDTALVKDGASAIRTLGSSVDTSVKALNPGTTSGDLDYYTAATTKARIAKGTAGQVFTMNSGATAPEWQTLNAGGMTLISTTSLTGASVTLSSIPQTYNNLQLVIQNYKPASDNEFFCFRFNGDATASRHRTLTSDGVNDGQTANGFNGTLGQVNANDNSVATSLMTIDFFNYTNTTTWKYANAMGISVNAVTTTSVNFCNKIIAYNQIGAVTSLTLLPESGNFTSGTALLYGVK